ncbi:hypothetical protein VNO77_28568 [Canavalia gladiata]|uniref:Uncharacterized protein n=1 Tax=Canavalia gladiata TaxID=3824 RepID=A0AAN9QB96_CANGL
MVHKSYRKIFGLYSGGSESERVHSRKGLSCWCCHNQERELFRTHHAYHIIREIRVVLNSSDWNVTLSHVYKRRIGVRIILAKYRSSKGIFF